jgi:hypothetical protein
MIKHWAWRNSVAKVLEVYTEKVKTGYKISLKLGVYQSYTKRDGEEVHNQYDFKAVAYNERARAVTGDEPHEKIAQCKEGDEVKYGGWEKTWEGEKGGLITYVDLQELEVLESAQKDTYSDDVPF